MIIVTVFLDSAISPTRDKELARMHICNIGAGDFPGQWNYSVETWRGRSKKELDKHVRGRQGEIENFRSDNQHVWYLVGKAIEAVNYHKVPK